MREAKNSCSSINLSDMGVCLKFSFRLCMMVQRRTNVGSLWDACPPACPVGVGGEATRKQGSAYQAVSFDCNFHAQSLEFLIL